MKAAASQIARLRKTSARGFTLIELLIVVGIIAILAAIAIPNLLAAQTRAKVSRAKADLRTIANSMEAYAVDQNGYPPDFDSGIYPGYPFAVGEYNTYRLLTTPVAYIATAPVDPFSVNGSVGNRLYEYYHEEAVRQINATSWANTWTDQGLR
jgi:type II secretion system protein G